MKKLNDKLHSTLCLAHTSGHDVSSWDEDNKRNIMPLILKGYCSTKGLGYPVELTSKGK